MNKGVPEPEASSNVSDKNKKKQYNREYHELHKDRLRLYSLWNNCRYRARQKSIEFTLSQEDIVVPDVCPILGIQMSMGFDSGRDSSPSVDRIDINKGYTSDNIQIISYLANRMKNNGTLEQLVLLGKWAEQELKRR